MKGKSFQVRKQHINNLLLNLEANSQDHHSEHLEKQATLLSTMLNEMDLKHVISLSDTEPEFIEIFGETEDEINEWHHATKIRIEDLIIRASKEVSEWKSATQTGFRKLSYPKFNGDVLNFLEFKKRWSAEVVPERKPVALELAALREYVPAIVKAKMTDVSTMEEAWKLLELDYGNLQEVRRLCS